MLRSVIGVVVGLVVWMAGFTLMGILLANLWPDYAVHGRAWFRENVFTFTSLMACFNLLLWALAAIGAGWAAMRIAQRHQAVYVLAALVFMYLALNHLVLYWPRFPWWYNLGVVIPCVPAVLFGGRLARGSK